MASVHVDDIEVKHLIVDLEKAPPQVAIKVSHVVAKTAHDIEADAKFLAPVDTGFLKGSISSSIQTFSAEIGPTASYGAAVEYGVPEPYVIVPKTPGGTLRFVVDGHVVFAKRVVHPPMRPHPYMRPAADRNTDPFADAIGKVASEFL